MYINNKSHNIQILSYTEDEFNLFPDNMINWNYSKKNKKIKFPFTLRTHIQIVQVPIIFDENSVFD